MSRNAVRMTVDVVLLLAVLGLVATGLLMSFVLPPRSGSAEVWGSTRHEWGDIHFWLAMSLLAVAVVHVALNWGWVCNVAMRLCGRGPGSRVGRNIVGAVFVLVMAGIVGGFLWAANASIDSGAGGRGQHRRDAAAEEGGPAGYGGGRQFRGGGGGIDPALAPNGESP